MLPFSSDHCLDDQVERWSRGERILVESYLNQHSELQSDQEAVLDLVFNEIMLREEFGETPTLEEYRQRFPQFSEALCRQFEVHQALSPNASTLPHPSSKPSEDRLPSLPGYEVLSKLGQGGIGAVYKARQLKLNRLVAIKVLRHWSDGDVRHLQRFLEEARAVAQLKHPNIVQIHDVGEVDGCPFLCLELVEGGSLDRQLNGQPQLPREAAKMVETLARAVDYVHHRQIIHCDLKPANILLEPTGTPKIADFGFAKLTGGETALSSDTGGTLHYMAPEQTGGRGKEIGPWSDVHALGAILYEMLTGRPPFLGSTKEEVLRQVLFFEPVAPQRLQPNTPRDLQTICLHCLEKDPRHRYTSAAALADDLQRFLENRPISIRPPSPFERGIKWCRRNPIVAGLSSALALLSVAAFFIITIKWLEARDERNQKESARQDERQRADDLAASNKRLREVLYVNQFRSAWGAYQAMDGPLAKSILLECEPELRSFEWHYLDRLLQKSRTTIPGDGEVIRSIAIAQNEKYAAISGSNHTIALLDLDRKEVTQSFKGHQENISDFRFIAGDQRLLSWSHDRTVRIWEVATGKELFQLGPFKERIRTAGWIPQSNEIVTVSDVGLSRLMLEFWEGGTGKKLRQVPIASEFINSVCFSRDCRQIAVFPLFRDSPGLRALGKQPEPAICIYNTADGKLLNKMKNSNDRFQTVDFTTDGKRLAASGSDKSVRVWDSASGNEVYNLRGHASEVYCLRFNEDGSRLASAGVDRGIKIWDMVKGREATTLVGHAKPILAVEFLPRSQRLLSGGQEKSLNIWPLENPESISLHGQRTSLIDLSFNREGTLLAGCHLADRAECSSLDPRQKGGSWKGSFIRVALSPDGSLMAAAGEKDVVVGDPRIDPPPITLTGLHNNPLLRFHPDSRRLVAIEKDVSAVRLIDAQTGATLARYSHEGLELSAPAISSDGKQVMAVSLKGGECIVWDIDSTEVVRKITTETCHLATFNPDGSMVATVAYPYTTGGTVHLWDSHTGQLLHTLQGHTNKVMSLAFSPDGRRLATGSLDCSVRLWDTATGNLLLTLPGVKEKVFTVTFSGNGQRLAAGGGEDVRQYEMNLWDGRSE